jgi:hypothetical protein
MPMSRRAGQIAALLGITILVIVAIWYQNRQDGSLKSSVLNIQKYGYGYAAKGASSGTSGTNSQALSENRPQFSAEENGIKVHKYLVPFDELIVLDALQVPLHVPSMSTAVEWTSANTAASTVIIDDMNAARTAFLSPDTEQELHFGLSVEKTTGGYERVARYEFVVISDLAFSADVNKDGKYDFQNDLVHLLRNWDSFGNDSTRTLALILSRLEE